MSKNRKEHMWHAYIDGELSTSEAAEFEASLNEWERSRLVIDMRFERVLAERLSENADCPDEVWARTEARLTEAGHPRKAKSPGTKRWYWGVATLAAAAALAFVISVFAPSGVLHESPAIIMAASTLEELADTSQTAHGSDAAEQFMRDNGINLDLLDDATLEAMEGPHVHVHIIGARQEQLAGEEVTEVLIGCCEFPMKILIAKLHTAAADEIGLAAAQDGHIQATRVVGDYLAAVVGHHDGAHNLVNLLSQ